MNVLVVADRPPGIDIVKTVAAENIQLVITLGDLAREDLLGLENVKHIPKIGVYGNHDGGDYMSELGIWDMHLKVWDYKDISFGGFQGCVRYKKDPYAIMCTQEEANILMKDFPKVDVFISHCPPRGINDEEDVAHQGFDVLRKYIDEKQPKVWLYGHTYPTDETVVKKHVCTRIEYVFKYKILTL